MLRWWMIHGASFFLPVAAPCFRADRLRGFESGGLIKPPDERAAATERISFPSERDEHPLRDIVREMRVDPRLPSGDAPHHGDMPPHQFAKCLLGAVGGVGLQELIIVHGGCFTSSCRSQANRTTIRPRRRFDRRTLLTQSDRGWELVSGSGRSSRAGSAWPRFSRMEIFCQILRDNPAVKSSTSSTASRRTVS
jgi:hypothetical protein